MPRQREPGWKCPECKLVRGGDQLDPCLGRLPGVIFACCGHGGRRKGDGYIYFENGTVIRFAKLSRVDKATAEEVAEALELKRGLGQ